MVNVPLNQIGITTPDPTALTMSQISREIAALREIFETRLNAIDTATKLFQENLTRVPTEVDKQICHLRSLQEVRFSSIEKEMQALDLRHQERHEASNRALQASSVAAKEAVSAALAAAKEAVKEASISSEKNTAAAFAASEKAIEKAEAAQHAHNIIQNEWHLSVNDAIKSVSERARAESESMVGSLRANTDISIRSLTDKIDGALHRLDRAEGHVSQKSSSQSTVIAVSAILISLVMATFTILSAVNKDSNSGGISVSPPVTLNNQTPQQGN